MEWKEDQATDGMDKGGGLTLPQGWNGRGIRQPLSWMGHNVTGGNRRRIRQLLGCVRVGGITLPQGWNGRGIGPLMGQPLLKVMISIECCIMIHSNNNKYNKR